MARKQPTKTPDSLAPPGARRLIAVDIGNSSTKIGWFADAPADAGVASASPLPQPMGTFDVPTGQTPREATAVQLPNEPCLWQIASVHREGQRILSKWIETHRPDDEVRVLSHADLPIAVRAEFPERVGLDRLAAAVAANVLRQADRPAIVIDAGSAITVDVVAGDGAFEGGVILPGFRMSAEALFGNADLLPLALLAPDAEPPPVLGKNTEAAIRSGLFWGAVGAVREIVTRMAVELGRSPQILVTGGDLRRLTPLVGDHVRYVPNMVLSGISIAAAQQLMSPGKPTGRSLR